MPVINGELLEKNERIMKIIQNSRYGETLKCIRSLYMANPTLEYELALESYCDILETSLDLDSIESKTNTK